MANTYSRINIHAIFGVKYRRNLLKDEFRENVFRFIVGILKDIKVYPICVGGYYDHVHILFECPPSMSVSDIISKVKSRSSKWINEEKFLRERFEWQGGYAAISHTRSMNQTVINYIRNQMEHHSGKSFRDEYLEFLKDNEIAFDEKYIMDFYDHVSDME